jgi:hypothetical protein
MTEDFTWLSPLSHRPWQAYRRATAADPSGPFTSRKQFGTIGRLVADEGIM